MNKNQLRETLRKHIHDAPYLDAGVERIVDQVVNPKVYSVFMPQIEEVVYKFLGLERPRARERNGGGFKDLLPKDLDPVSPESDKNSLKDVSLDSVDAEMGVGGDAGNFREENDSKNTISGNGVSESSEKSTSDVPKVFAGSASSAVALDTSGKSEDKPEEEEEESPVFEPIDIMNLNESNISNDSHLSGISELTSHRSRSPDFSNETSRDNMDFSNQDSQLSKVSSDSRLSIVTDFGSSNHASGPETPKDERDKNEVKFGKDNFRAVRDFDGSKVKEGRLSYDGSAGKEAGDSKDKSRNDVSRSRNSKEVRKANKESRKKSSSDGKGNKVKKIKEKSESSRDIASKESSTKVKDERVKETEKKENSQGKEVKDLKDIYKEKIRELREKKELTEKEKLSKDTKSSKETKEKRDSSREGKKDTKDSKESKSSTLKSHSSRSESKTLRSEGKSSRSESRSSKRDDRKSLKDPRSKSQGGSDSNEKVDGRRSSKSEKDEKTEKSELRQDSKSKSFGKSSKNDSNKNSEGKRDSKSELEARDKKRRDDKKSKVKDDHSSARKSSDDRRSTDRDGSNGSNGKTSQKNNSNPSTTTNKSVTSNLSKESTTTSNSSSETSDSIEERQNEKSAINVETKTSKFSRNQANHDPSIQRLNVGSNEITLPIKKRPLNYEDPPSSPASSDALMKKPKFAKNFQEAKRLMKIRRRMEREKLKKQVEPKVEIKSQQPPQIPAPPKKVIEEDLKLVPDEERVQIIEVCDEEYDEPYPEVRSDFTLEERSQIILGGESIFTGNFIAKQFHSKSTLSEMELSIRQSLKEMICDNLDEAKDTPKNSLETEIGSKIQESVVGSSNPLDIEATIFGNSSLCSEIAENVKTSNKNQAKEVTEENSRKNENSTRESEKNQSPEVSEKIEDPETNENLEVLEKKLTVEEQLEETCEFKNIVREMEKMEGNSEKIIVENSKMDETVGTTKNSETTQENIKNPKNLEANSQANRTFEMKNKVDDEKIEREESKSHVNSRTEMPSKENEEEEKKVTASSDEKPRRVSGTGDPEAEPETTKICRKESQNAEVETENSKYSKPEEKVDENDEEMAEEQTDVRATLPETKEAEEEEPETKEIEQPEVRDDKKWLEDERSSTCNKQRKEKSSSPSEEEKETLSMSDDEGPCLYFVEDTEKLEKFRKFLKTLEHEENLGEDYTSETSSTEISCSMSKTMAPPKPKRKYSTSPLSDILLNNANNNNDAHKSIELISDHEDTDNNMKKRKIGRPKKQKINANLCTQQNLSNGENFVMPLSPESDVSATSEKAPSNPLKDEKR